MKKKFTVLLLAALIASLSACTAQRDSFQIFGTSKCDQLFGKTIVLTVYNDDGTVTADSTIVGEKGDFHFSGKVSRPCVAKFTIRRDSQFAFVNDFSQDFYIENSNIHVKLRPTKFFDRTCLAFDIHGSKANNKLQDICSDVIVNNPWMFEFYDETTPKVIGEHLDDIYGPFLYYLTFYTTDDEAARSSQLAKFSGAAIDTYHYKLMKQQL